MKYFEKFSEYIFEKVDVDKYLPKVDKAKTNKYPAEIKAMMDVIAFAEGTWGKDGYNTQFTGKKFADMSDHPRELISANGLKSTAAGRYQFLSKTWDGVMKGKDFSPENQDEGAYKLMKRRRMIRPLKKGDIKKALYNGRQEWASFPWSPYGQNAWFASNDKDKYEVLRDLYWKRLKQYKPSVEIPEDLDGESISTGNGNGDGEQTVKAKKKRSGAGYNGGDDFPFIVGSSNGDAVKTLQRAIIKLGGELPVYGVDSKFGPETMGATKWVLSKLKEWGKWDGEGTITNELSKENAQIILDAIEDETVLKKIESEFKKVDYNDYSENIPMVDGVLEDGTGIFNVGSISKFINKLKNKEDVKIYHIGDSHIEAPWMTDAMEKGINELTDVDYDKNATHGWRTTTHIKNKSKIQSDMKNANYDLVIISLGGNDAYTYEKNFNANKFEANYNSLIDIVKSVDSDVEILLTTPFSGIYPDKKKANPNKVLTQSACYDLANKQNLAVWDIFKKMGGLNAVYKWKKQGLVQKDGVHLTPSGYKKVGKMFVNDLKNYVK
jgi:muramidase (phage lysozyme)